MRSVNVATLKNRLSSYLREVRRGEESLIRDRVEQRIQATCLRL